MPLITLIDKISEALDNDDFVIGVFLDFSKAFDTVDHSILLKNVIYMELEALHYNGLKVTYRVECYCNI